MPIFIANWFGYPLKNVFVSAFANVVVADINKAHIVLFIAYILLWLYKLLEN